MRAWDSNTGQCIHTFEYAHESAITGIDAAPKHKTFATSSADGIGYVWNVETFEVCGSIKGHSAEISHIKWNAVLDCWVTASEDSTVRNAQLGARRRAAMQGLESRFSFGLRGGMQGIQQCRPLHPAGRCILPTVARAQEGSPQA